MPGVDNNCHTMLHLNGNGTDASQQATNWGGSGSGFVTSPKVFGSHAISFNAQSFAALTGGGVNANRSLFASTGDTRSLDFWFRSQNLSSPNPQIIWAEQRFTTIQNNHMEIQWSGNGFVIEGIGSGGGGANYSTPDLVTPGIIAVNTWYHILMIRINNVVAFYVNGVQVSYGTIGTTSYVGAGTLAIGWSAYTPQQNLNAYLDEVRLYHGNYFNVNPNVGLTDTFTVPTEEYNGTALNPQNLTAVLGEVPEEQIDLSWDYPAAQPINPIYGYKIEQKETEDGVFSTLVANTGVHKRLALRFNGQNGGKEIIDSGAIGYVATQNGNAQLDTVDKKFGSTSLKLDGSGDYVTVPDSADWDFFSSSTQDITIDFWLKSTAAVDSYYIWSHGATVGTNDSGIAVTATGISFFIRTGGVIQVLVASSASTNPYDGNWHHYAITKIGTTYGIYQDGVQIAYTSSGTLASLNGTPRLGGRIDGTANFPGSIDEFRIQYSNSFSAVPNAGLTNTVTVPTAEHISDSNTKLLLHFNTHDISGDAGSANYHIPTFIGNAQLSTAQKQFGLSSLLLDGSGDYLSIPNSADWNFGSADFTFDLWIRPNAISASDTCLIFQGTSSPNFWELGYDTTSLFLKVGTNTYTVAWTPSINTWYHIACSRYSNNLRFFVNGTQQGATQSFSENLSFSGTMLIGSGVSAQEFNGYMDNLIITNRAKYVANFTAPTIESDDSTRFWKGQSNLDPETVYYYRAYALNFDGQGQVSNTAFEFTENIRPREPQNLTLTPLSPTSVQLDWEEPLDIGIAPITGYTIERKTDDDVWEVLVEDTEETENLTYVDSGLDVDSQYHYRVSAINEEGTSRPSNTERLNFRAGINENTILMMGLNSLPFSDSSPAAHGNPANSAVTLDTTNKVFGAGSAAFNGIRTIAGSELNFANHADWDLFDDFDDSVVLDWRVRFNSLSSTQCMIVHQHTTTLQGNHWILRWKGDRFAIHGVEGNLTSNWMPEMQTGDLVATEVVTTGVWYHVVFVKIGNVGALYVNGRQYAYTASLLSVENQVEGTFGIGRTGFSAGDGLQTLNGNIDEPRIILENWFNASPNSELTDTLWIPNVAYTGVPSAPQNLDAIAVSSSAIDLDWDAPASDGGSPITGYRIERSLDGDDWDIIVEDSESTDTFYSDTGLDHATLYFYRVAAINSVGLGAYASASETTFATTPTAPQNLTAVTQSSTEILLDWDAPLDDGGSPITGYKIYVESPVGGGFIVLVANTMSTDTEYLDTGLSPNTEYNYKIRAINAIGEGPFSNEAAATTLGFVRHIDKLTGKMRFGKQIAGRVFMDMLTGQVYIKI